MKETIRKFKLLEVNIRISELITNLKEDPSVLPGSVHIQSTTNDNSSATTINCILNTGLNLMISMSMSTDESGRFVHYEVMLTDTTSQTNVILFNDEFNFRGIAKDVEQLLEAIRQHYRNEE